MSVIDKAPSHVRGISPYQPGKPVSELAREFGLSVRDIVKLASNENPLGMSRFARDAAVAALGDTARYPDGNGYELKSAISKRFGVRLEQIVLGNGSNDVLELAARAFIGKGQSAVFSQYAFAVYPLATLAVGGRCIEVPAANFGHDAPAMVAAIEADTRVLFIANPNNPTGSFLPGDQVKALIAAVPTDVLVVLDEAYTEYLSAEQAYNSLEWLDEYPNLLVSRTFSKAYGLAGLRVGYGVGHPDVIDLMNRVRQPFNVSSVALAAATASLDDEEFIARSAELNRRGMAQLKQAFADLELPWIESAANFITVKVGDAAKVNAALLRQGVIVRPISGYGMPEWLRVSIGLPEENVRFIEALSSVLSKS